VNVHAIQEKTMRKKKYKKLVKELKTEVSKLQEELKGLKEVQLRQVIVNRLNASAAIAERQKRTYIVCPRCKEETYIKIHENLNPRCYSCNYPQTQASINTWLDYKGLDGLENDDSRA
jgi:ribosomal protein L37E